MSAGDSEFLLALWAGGHAEGHNYTCRRHFTILKRPKAGQGPWASITEFMKINLRYW